MFGVVAVFVPSASGQARILSAIKRSCWCTHRAKLRSLLQVFKRMILHRRRGTGWCVPVDGPDGSLRCHGPDVPRELLCRIRHVKVNIIVFVCLQNQLIDHLEQHGLGRQDLDFATWSGLLGAFRHGCIIHFGSCLSYVSPDSCHTFSVSDTVCRYVCKSSRRAYTPTSTELAVKS